MPAADNGMSSFDMCAVDRPSRADITLAFRLCQGSSRRSSAFTEAETGAFFLLPSFASLPLVLEGSSMMLMRVDRHACSGLQSFPGASDQVSSCYTLAQLTSGSSRTTLPPISTLFPDLHRTSAPLSAALPYAPWHDDILSLAHPGPFQRHQQHPPSHQQDKEEYTASRQPSLGEAQSRFAQRRIYNARHTTAGHRFPEPSNSRTSMKPDEGLASTRVRLSVRSSSDLSDLSDDSSRSEPSPAAPRSCSGGPNRTTQTRVTRADSTVRSAMPPPRPGEPAIGDLKRYTFPATRNLHVGQMFRSTKPAAPASAAASKSARPRAGSMMSPEPAERPQIKRSLSWQAQRDVKAESPALEADHPSARRSSSPLSEFDAEDAAGHGDESHQTATRRMRSFDASSHCPVGDSESLLDSTEWDMRSKHGRVLTRRSKVIVNDTDRRRRKSAFQQSDAAG